MISVINILIFPEEISDSEREKLQDANEINDIFLDAARKRSEAIASGRPVKPYQILAVGRKALPIDSLPEAPLAPTREL